MDLLLVLVATSFGRSLGYLGYVSMARTQYTIDAVTVSQEHCTSRLSNLVDTKNKSSRRARQLQSIAGGNPPGEAARLICSVPIPLLSSLWIKNGQGLESRYVNTNRLYLLGPQTLDFPRLADCLGNFVDTPFPGS
ncbi:hypothetical protein N7524_002439 [Penicillium chrysogenum]|nr:hypothetical protein N7524_002439 [Penicillium chrysogenum]